MYHYIQSLLMIQPASERDLEDKEEEEKEEEEEEGREE